MIPESSEAGFTCGRSTKLETSFPADHTCDLSLSVSKFKTQTLPKGSPNLMSVILGL